MTTKRTDQDIAWLSQWAERIAQAHGYKGVIILGGDGERGKMVVGCVGLRPEQVKIVLADLIADEAQVDYVSHIEERDGDA